MKRKHLENAEKVFAVLGLFFFTGAFDIGITLETGPLVPSLIRTAIRYFVWVTAFTLIGLNWKDALRTVNRDRILWILIPIILLSFIWSDNLEFTLRNSREVWQMSTFGLYLATRFSLKEQVRLVAWTFAVAILVSTILALVLPDIGKHTVDHPGAWRGIYDYKNTFGSMMLISSLAFFLLPIDNPKHRFYKRVGIGVSLVMMLLSTSKTSLVIYILLVLILAFYHKFRWQGKISVIFVDITVLLLGCLATVVASYWVTLLTGLGKDPTLTGRTLMWSYILFRVSERPWLGFGRGVFWEPGSKYPTEAGQALGNGFIPPHAHNGFIDFALDVGFIGLSLFLISYFTAFVRALKRAYATKNPEDVWPLGFLIFLAMNNMTESQLLRLSNIYWVLYLAVAFSVKQIRQTNNLKTG